MRKIFIVTANSVSDYKEFINSIRTDIPNIVSIDYYDFILGEVYKVLEIDGNKYQQYNSIEQYWFKKDHRQSLINKVIKAIEFRDAPRTILIMLCNNRVVANRIKRAFPKISKTILLETNSNVEIVNKNIPQLIKPDIRLEIPNMSDKKLKTRIFNSFINKHIPVKWKINNE